MCKYENVQKGKCADIKCANRKMCQYEDVQTGKCANMKMCKQENVQICTTGYLVFFNVALKSIFCMNSTFMNREGISCLETMSTKSAKDGGAIYVIGFNVVYQHCLGSHLSTYFAYSGSTFIFFAESHH